MHFFVGVVPDHHSGPIPFPMGRLYQIEQLLLRSAGTELAGKVEDSLIQGLKHIGAEHSASVSDFRWRVSIGLLPNKDFSRHRWRPPIATCMHKPTRDHSAQRGISGATRTIGFSPTLCCSGQK